MQDEYELTPAVRAKFDAHLDELFSLLDPDVIGHDYAAARASGDRAGMIRASAAYYRAKPAPDLPDFAAGDYDLAAARRAAAGHIRVINIDHDFPDGEIDFLYNPTLEHPPVNHEWLWQLNRHNWWPVMADAYAGTGDETLAAAFDRQLRHWIAETDLPANWNAPGSAWRTIECGLRLLGSWQAAFNLFRTSPSVSDETLLLMIASMHRQAVHLDAHPTGGNWLMMESNGTYTFCSLFPELSDAERMRAEAGRRLATQLESQILPDGFQYELSPDYHVVTFGCAMGLYKVAAALGRTGELPDSYRKNLKSMAMAAVNMMTPALVQPRTNDCYTMRTSIVTRTSERLFPEEPAFAFVNSGRTSGHEPSGGTASRFLPWAGYAAMRSDWSADASYLCFDVGPLGMGHWHQDKLNVILWKGGEELIFDDGGGQYEQSAARAYGLSGYDHNVLTVDGQVQSRSGPKRVDAPIDAGWVSSEQFDYAFGVYEDSFSGGLGCAAVHRREVRFCKPDLFVIRDTVTSADGQAHEYGIRFHTDCVKTDAVPGLPGAVLSDCGRTWDVLIVPLAEPGSPIPDVKTVCGQTDPMCGWFIGRNDLVNHPATTVLISASPARDCRFTTLLIPVRRSEPLPAVSVDADGMITVTVGGQSYVIDRNNLDQ